MKIKIGGHNSNADIRNKAADYVFYNTDGITEELHGWTAKTADIGTAIRVIPCSDFPSEAMWWIKEVEMVDSLEEFTFFAINCWKEFLKLRDAGREDCFCSEQDHPEFPIQEEGQSRGAESPNGGPVSTRKTDRFYDLRLISSYWRSWSSIGYAGLLSLTLRDDNVQEFDTRWDEVVLSMSKIPSDDVLESLCKLRISESEQLKIVLELYEMEIHQKDIDAQWPKIEDDGENK